ncbi:MAG: MMPL family transporter [Lachnospiraceae bacterium]|nr:MMPL family transporter [Lachnospiraceae bacterium]
MRIGHFIAKHKKLIALICLLLLIPSVLGYVKTRINYDVVSYLPGNLETMKGQDIMVDEFGTGAFSMVIVEGMEPKEVVNLKKDMMKVEHVKDILWYDSLVDISVPMDMIPDDLRENFDKGDDTMMIVFYDNITSSDDTMDAVANLRKVVSKDVYISGMAGIVTDIKDLFLQEMPIYVAVAASLSLAVLILTLDSFVVPFLFLFSIGTAILYNLGSNVFLGEISYITQALVAVLQLGVTMDYSIFLLNSYEDNKKRLNGDNEEAMAQAISATFKSVLGSSVTTVAGFIALLFMTYTLGKDIGIVMAKGVIIGVICCVTFLPSLILIFDKWIDKTTHRSLIPDLSGLSDFLTKHYKVFILIFIVMLPIAYYGNNHVNVYYNLDETLPADLLSSKAKVKLDDTFQMNSAYVIMMDSSMEQKDKSDMIDQLEEVKGVKFALGIPSIVGNAVPESMIPSKATEMLRSDKHELAFICSDYKTASDELNDQIDSVQSIIKSYDKDAILVGEGPLTKDLIDITDIDLQHVNVVSIAAILMIIMLVFKSISLPIILVSVIEFAIMINMAVPYYTGVQLPFIASIIIGTIQLGATVDYAILMTTKYQEARLNGVPKKEAVSQAHRFSIKSIIISGLSLFAATIGVRLYSRIDIIGSICALLSRGAIISTVVVLTVLPAMFMVFDKLICMTTLEFRRKKS